MAFRDKLSLGKQLRIEQVHTIAERDAIATPQDGAVIRVDTGTEIQFQWYDLTTTSWKALGSATQRIVQELVVPTAQNVLPDLTYTPFDVNAIIVTVNGSAVDTIAGSGIGVSGQAVTVTAGTLGYNIETSDRVTYRYETEDTGLVIEVLTITAQNTIANLSSAPADSNLVEIIFNGQVFDTLGGSGFNLSGQAVTAVPATLGTNVETTDRIVARYTI